MSLLVMPFVGNPLEAKMAVIAWSTKGENGNGPKGVKTGLQSSALICKNDKFLMVAFETNLHYDGHDGGNDGLDWRKDFKYPNFICSI